MDRVAARLTLVVDAEDEEKAREIAHRLLGRTGLETVFIDWALYPKTGAHSQISFALLLPPETAGQAVIDAVEGVAARAVGPQALVDGYLSGFLQEDGSLVYNRIFDARTDAFLVPDILWLDVEIETHPEAQANFQRALKQEE